MAGRTLDGSGPACQREGVARRGPARLPAGPCRADGDRSVVVLVVVVSVCSAGDLPDDAGLGDLDQRPAEGNRWVIDEPGPRIRDAEVAHGAVIHQVQGAVRPEQ